jgi:hypothetical protein
MKAKRIQPMTGKMRNVGLLAGIMIASLSIVKAQSQGAIVGQVSDFQSGKPVKAYVLLYNDSTLLGGVASDSAGHFKLDHVPQGMYSVHVKLIGYQTEVTPMFQVHTASTNLQLNLNKIPRRLFGAALWRKRKVAHMYL